MKSRCFILSLALSACLMILLLRWWGWALSKGEREKELPTVYTRMALVTGNEEEGRKKRRGRRKDDLWRTMDADAHHFFSFSSSDSSSSSPVLVAHLANLAVVVVVIRATIIMPSWLFFKLNVIIWLPSLSSVSVAIFVPPCLRQYWINKQCVVLAIAGQLGWAT